MAAAATVVVAGAALAMSPPSSAAPTGTPHTGTAKATAVVARVAPGVGSLELALGSGISVSQLTNSVAQAQAQALDLGFIGTALTTETCDDPILTNDQLPQPTRVDNRAGDAMAEGDEVPVAGPSTGGGRERVEATTLPLGRALTSGAEVDLPGLLTVRAGRADTTVRAVEGGREAHSVVEVGLDVAGLLTLQGLRWEATHRSGTDPAAHGSFEVARGAAFGLPLPIESLGPLQRQLDAVLAVTGISVQLPTVERFTEPADLIRVTPLRIVMKDTPLGKAVLGPVLNATRAAREDLFEALSAAVCEMADVLLVGDIFTSIVAGTGFLAIEIGGVEATSGELVRASPFDSAPPTTAPTTTPHPPTAAPEVAAPAAPAPPPVATPAPSAPAPIAEVGPLESFCESVHPFDWPSCSHGAALPLGVGGLAITGLMAVLDWRHQRGRLAAAAEAAAP